MADLTRAVYVDGVLVLPGSPAPKGVTNPAATRETTAADFHAEADPFARAAAGAAKKANRATSAKKGTARGSGREKAQPPEDS